MFYMLCNYPETKVHTQSKANFEYVLHSLDVFCDYNLGAL